MWEKQDIHVVMFGVLFVLGDQHNKGENKMDYNIVHLKERTIAGLAARTNNGATDMETTIGGLWSRFYGEGVYHAIPGKVNERAMGVYTDYAEDEKGDYTVVVACETAVAPEILAEMRKKADSGLPEDLVARILPAGKYARFVIRGNMHRAVAEFWQKLWNLNLPRSFVCDFEEYLNSDDTGDNSEIHIYIGLKV